MGRRMTILAVLVAVLVAATIIALRPTPSPTTAPEHSAEQRGRDVDVGASVAAAESPAPERNESGDSGDFAQQDSGASADGSPADEFEARIIVDGSISVRAFFDLVNSDDYYTVVAQLRSRSEADAAYRYSEARTALESHDWVSSGRVTIDNMGCNDVICITTIKGQSVAELEQFNMQPTEANPDGYPGLGRVRVFEIVEVDGGAELRLLTAATALGSVMFPPPDQ